MTERKLNHRTPKPQILRHKDPIHNPTSQDTSAGLLRTQAGTDPGEGVQPRGPHVPQGQASRQAICAGGMPSSHTHPGQLALQSRKGLWKREHRALPWYKIDHSMNAWRFKQQTNTERRWTDYPQPRTEGSSLDLRGQV